MSYLTCPHTAWLTIKKIGMRFCKVRCMSMSDCYFTWMTFRNFFFADDPGGHLVYWKKAFWKSSLRNVHVNLRGRGTKKFMWGLEAMPFSIDSGLPLLLTSKAVSDWQLILGAWIIDCRSLVASPALGFPWLLLVDWHRPFWFCTASSMLTKPSGEYPGVAAVDMLSQ